MKRSMRSNVIRRKLKIKKKEKLKFLRSDIGGEYFPKKFDNLCEEFGIIHQRTAPYTPQQNGYNRTFNEMVNSILLSAKLPKNLWGEALLTTCPIHNRIPSRKRKVSPYEIWKGRNPILIILKCGGVWLIIGLLILRGLNWDLEKSEAFL